MYNKNQTLILKSQIHIHIASQMIITYPKQNLIDYY